MAGHSFPVSLGLPRWRPCQIPDPGPTLKCQNPYPGEGTLSQFPVGSPPPWGLTLIGALLNLICTQVLILVKTFGTPQVDLQHFRPGSYKF